MQTQHGERRVHLHTSANSPFPYPSQIPDLKEVLLVFAPLPHSIMEVRLTILFESHYIMRMREVQFLFVGLLRFQLAQMRNDLFCELVANPQLPEVFYRSFPHFFQGAKVREQQLAALFPDSRDFVEL